MAKKSSKSTTKAPWKKSNPRKTKGKASKHLTPAKKAAAKASAKKAGRPYPNLIDNMKAAKKKTPKKAKKSAASKTSKKKTAKKKAGKSSAKKSSKKKRSAKADTGKDPKGGLTAAGRRIFAKKDGAHLKPGVTKPVSEMTPTEMRRKGSWAVRFYGRTDLPPLVDRNGEPTRLALSAHAWGEPVPKTVAAARRIAAKGQRLLKKYAQAKKKSA